MLKKKNISGILTITSVVTLILIALLIWSQAEMVKAFYVKLAMANAALVFASAGIYLTDVFVPDVSPAVKRINWYLAGFLVTLATLCCFNILPFSTSWNWLMVIGILFVLFVQMQLLHWGKRVPQVVRFSALFIVLCDTFLVFFFVARWHNYQLASWINLAAGASVILTILGLLFLRKKKVD